MPSSLNRRLTACAPCAGRGEKICQLGSWSRLMRAAICLLYKMGLIGRRAEAKWKSQESGEVLVMQVIA